MSRTYKDKPYHLGGQRHKYYCSPNGHAAFTRFARRQARHDLNRQFKSTGELILKSRWDYIYFD